VYNNPSARQEVGFITSSPFPTHDTVLQGIFQGRLVGQTFLEHLQIINNIDPNERVQEPPVSVLILAVQAVRHPFVTVSQIHNVPLGTPSTSVLDYGCISVAV
jgi:hypothetical protein